MTTYNDKLDANDQISMEETIASILFSLEAEGFGEEDAGFLSRQILLTVLTKFRPDLIAETV
jgi:hypothetical protein